MKPLKRTLIRGVLVCCMFSGVLPAAADDLPLAQQMEQLRHEVQTLQARVQQLEQSQRTGAVAAPATAASPAATTSTSSGTPMALSAPAVVPPTSMEPALQSIGRLKEAWKGIDSGMSEAQVHARLGTPGRIFTIAGKTIWYYSYEGVGSGSVAFTANSKKVIDRQNPPFGFW